MSMVVGVIAGHVNLMAQGKVGPARLPGAALSVDSRSEAAPFGSIGDAQGLSFCLYRQLCWTAVSTNTGVKLTIPSTAKNYLV